MWKKVIHQPAKLLKNLNYNRIFIAMLFPKGGYYYDETFCGATY